MKGFNFFLIGILTAFLITRLYLLNTNPPSLYWDEASIAVNAHSIIQDGRDEWGRFLPLHFRAFGEFKLPVFIYTVSAFEKILGLNEFAVRLPAVIFSLVSLILTYLLTVRLTKNKMVGLISIFIFTTLPWFFIISRVGYEATAGLAFYLLGIYLFLKISEKKIWLLFATISFILSAYSYNAFRIIAPLSLVILTVYLFNSSKIHFKKLAFIGGFCLILYIVSFIPIVRLLTAPNNPGRLQTIGILSSGVTTQDALVIFSKNYISHFSPNFLFINGDGNFRDQQSGFGQLFWIQLPFLLLGLLFVFKNKHSRGYLIVVLILISPLPAAITRESPHALRSISALPFVSMLIALGIYQSAKYFKNTRVLYGSFIVLVTISFLTYFYKFISLYPQESAQDWQYGYKKLFLDYGHKFRDFDRVVISDYLAQPYIFSLFYLKINPRDFRETVSYNSVDKWGFSTVAGFSNLDFTSVNIKNLPKGKLLVFASSYEKLESAEKDVIKNLDGTTAFYVYEYEN